MLLEGATSKVCPCHISHAHSKPTDFLPELSLISLYSAYSLLSLHGSHSLFFTILIHSSPKVLPASLYDSYPSL